MNSQAGCSASAPGSLLDHRRRAPAGAAAWAPAGSATIKPGNQTFTEGAQCTSNFIFEDGSNTTSARRPTARAPARATDTNGCDSGSLPIGTPVEVDRREPPGNPRLQLVADDAGDRRDQPRRLCSTTTSRWSGSTRPTSAKVNPSVPGFGGPTGLGGVRRAMLGDTVYTYGNSSLRGGVTKLSPKQGVVAQSEGNGWSRTVYTVTPGIPGDSGSGFFDGIGQGDRRAQHAAARPGPGLERGRRPAQASSTTCAPTARSAASAWSTAPSRSTPDLVGAILGS